MPNIDAAVQWAVDFANDDQNGYSQPRRTEEHEADCSELVRRAFKAGGGFDLGDYMWTGNEDSVLMASGQFQRLDFSRDAVQRGDILWTSGHTEIAVDHDTLVGAWGDYDGARGDSSGREISVHGYWSDSWQRIYRPTVDDGTTEEEIVTDQDKQDIINGVVAALGGEQVILNWNSEGKQVWVCGDKLHWLDEPDTTIAVKQAYKASHGGRDIPCVDMGQEGSPWASRLKEACEDGCDELVGFEADHK